MKKFVLTLLILTGMAATSVAEDYKMWAGGSVGLDFVSVVDGDNVASVGVAPEFGYRINKHWAVAGEMGYNFTYSDGDDIHSFYIGPYVRYTFFDNDRLSFFGEGAFHYAHIDQGWAGDGMELILRPGMLFKLNDRWSLTGKVNLLEYAYIDENHGFGFHLTTGLKVGVIYNF